MNLLSLLLSRQQRELQEQKYQSLSSSFCRPFLSIKGLSQNPGLLGLLARHRLLSPVTFVPTLGIRHHSLIRLVFSI